MRFIALWNLSVISEIQTIMSTRTPKRHSDVVERKSVATIRMESAGKRLIRWCASLLGLIRRMANIYRSKINKCPNELIFLDVN